MFTSYFSFGQKEKDKEWIIICERHFITLYIALYMMRMCAYVIANEFTFTYYTYM